MIISPFTLIHRRGGSDRAVDQSKWLGTFQERDPEVAAAFRHLPKRLQRSLSNSLTTLPATDEMTLQAFHRVMRELTRRRRVVTVGFWDIGSKVGYLPRIIDELNIAQPAFAFFDVQAPIPAGLISRPQRVAEWAAALRKKRVSSGEIDNNIIDDDFFVRGERVRKELGIQYLIGIAPSMVAGVDEGTVFWNHFASTRDHCVLVSTCDLRDFAARARKPFEVAVALVALAGLLVGINPHLDYHDDTGCLFDYNESRVSLVRSIRRPRIEKRCLQLMRSQYRSAAEAFVMVLSRYSQQSRWIDGQAELKPESGIVAKIAIPKTIDQNLSRVAPRPPAFPVLDDQVMSFSSEDSLMLSEPYAEWSLAPDLPIAEEEMLGAVLENQNVQSESDGVLGQSGENEELDLTNRDHHLIDFELVKLSEELETRNNELTQATDDLTNILASGDTAIVLLDSDLRIRRFSSVAEHVLELSTGDVGRSIADVSAFRQLRDLDELIAGVIKSPETRESYFKSRLGNSYRLRVTPYGTSDNKIDGAVLTLLRRSDE